MQAIAKAKSKNSRIFSLTFRLISQHILCVTKCVVRFANQSISVDVIGIFSTIVCNQGFSINKCRNSGFGVHSVFRCHVSIIARKQTKNKCVRKYNIGINTYWRGSVICDILTRGLSDYKNHTRCWTPWHGLSWGIFGNIIRCAWNSRPAWP